MNIRTLESMNTSNRPAKCYICNYCEIYNWGYSTCALKKPCLFYWNRRLIGRWYK